MYQVGEKVLLCRLLGQEVDPPVQCVVTRTGLISFLLDYEIEVPRVETIDTGRVVENVRVWAKDDWLAPDEIVINEMPESFDSTPEYYVD